MGFYTKFIKGSDIIIPAKLKDTESGENFDILTSPITGCTGYFEKDDDTCVAVSGTVTSAALSEIQFEVANEESDLFRAGDPMSYEIEIDQGSKRTVFQMIDSLGIIEKIC